jgi:tetratricopeptide (TPR) repeat protein
LPSLAKGEFALVEQSMQTAREKSVQPVKNGSMAHEHNLYMLLSEAAVQRRDISALQQYVPLLEELATRDGHRLYLAIAHRAWGVAHRLAGEFVESEARLNQAVELFRDYGVRWQLGRTFFELGELGVARSDSEMARQGFTQAINEFESMQALPDLERTRAALGLLVENGL